jgi:hypothetical protein
VDVLADRPSQYARKVEDIGLILKNMHHLLNLLRPHQVREQRVTSGRACRVFQESFGVAASGALNQFLLHILLVMFDD